MNPPLEIEEQESFVQWLESVSLPFTAIPNSTYTTSHKQKRKNAREGLRAGFPDIVVIIPTSKSKDGEGYMLCIEMKRSEKKLSKLSTPQKDWQEHINNLDTNVHAYVAYGFDEARFYTGHYLK